MTQDNTSIVLGTLLNNTGTDQANNTTFGWTLPSGWSIDAGDVQNISYGALAVGESFWNNLTVTIADDATTGTQTYYISATCLNCTNQTKEVQTYVNSRTGTTTASGGAEFGHFNCCLGAGL